MSVSAQQLAMTHNYVIQAVNITSLSMTLWYSFITYCFHNKLATAGNYNFANSNSSVMSIAFYWRPMVGNYKLGQYVQSCQSSIDTFSSNIVPSTNYKLQIQSSKKVKCFNYWSGVINWVWKPVSEYWGRIIAHSEWECRLLSWAEKIYSDEIQLVRGKLWQSEHREIKIKTWIISASEI